MINKITPEIIYKSDAWQKYDDIEQVVKDSCSTVISHFDIKNSEVSVVLADDKFVKELNKKYRHKDKPTNVLSFPAMDEYNMENIEQLGDIIIAFETTAQEAKNQNKKFINHFTHLTVHGLLHLLGYDHMEKKQAEEMEELEKTILLEMGIDDPYEGADLIG